MIWSIWSAIISFALLALLSVLLYSIRQVFRPVLIEFICYWKLSNVSRWISILLFSSHINLDSLGGPEVLISLRLLYSQGNQSILKIKEISLLKSTPNMFNWFSIGNASTSFHWTSPLIWMVCKEPAAFISVVCSFHICAGYSLLQSVFSEVLRHGIVELSMLCGRQRDIAMLCTSILVPQPSITLEVRAVCEFPCHYWKIHKGTCHPN